MLESNHLPLSAAGLWNLVDRLSNAAAAWRADARYAGERLVCWLNKASRSLPRRRNTAPGGAMFCSAAPSKMP